MREGAPVLNKPLKEKEASSGEKLHAAVDDEALGDDSEAEGRYMD
jgi:hypothetical protein